MKGYSKKIRGLRLYRAPKGGFTLMELMIAVAIIVVAITGTLAAYVNASLLRQANRNKAIAVADASYVLEKIKSYVSYNDLASYTDANFTDLNLPDESMVVTVTSGSNAKTVVANVTWSENGRQRSFTLTTQISI